MKPTVFLSGPIANIDYMAANNWRSCIADSLLPGIGVTSPMRSHGKPFNADAKALTARDRFDCTHASLVLTNLLEENPKKPSLGTMIELGWADAARVPVLLVADMSFDHPMVESIVSWRTNDLNEAIEIIDSFLEPYITEIPKTTEHHIYYQHPETYIDRMCPVEVT